MTVLLITLLAVTGLLHFTKTQDKLLNVDWDNKLIRHHALLIKDMEGQKPKDCWICTHSPVSARTMPYLALPLEPWQVLTPHCIHNETWTQSRFWGKDVPRDISASLAIIGWTANPWFQFNITRPKVQMWWREYDSDVGDVVARRRTEIPRSDPIPNDGLWFSLQNAGTNTCGEDNNCFRIYTHDQARVNKTIYQDGVEGCKAAMSKTLRKERDKCTYGISRKQMNNTWCAHKPMMGLLNLYQCIQTPGHVCVLPEGVFLVCGHRAYRWVSPDIRGVCTLAKLTPATFIVLHSKIDTAAVPIHTLYRRAADNKPRSSGRPHLVEMGITNKIFSSILIYPFITQMWDKLVEATDYLDDQIFQILEVLNETNTIQRQLIIVTNQHTIVLDYLTAKEGGMCQIIGPTCCNYIDPAGNLQIKASIDKIGELRRPMVNPTQCRQRLLVGEHILLFKSSKLV
ncbi:uncharacterized protein LOC143781145 [Ranitomeya variabilis]|uniref:uncharacterized protein LOC143781145 n=1 Tax=Ranitomeya variabilis TaxID=490064 RepID=UPI0040571054